MPEQHPPERLPQHLDMRNAPTDRRSRAPYNFVPLPDQIVRAYAAAEDVPTHDRYDPELKSGWFNVTLTTRSLVYVRGMLTLAEFQRTDANDEQERALPFRQQARHTPEFFHTGDPSAPVIPGSTLRGMLRTIIEIAGYGKIDRVTRERLFYRTVDNTSVGLAYRKRMVDKVEAGFLIPDGDDWAVVECEMLRVPRGLLRPDLYDGRPPNRTPNWRYQHRQVWVQRNPVRSWEVAAIEPTDGGAGWEEGRLVITGDAPGKEREFVFLMPAPQPRGFQVPEHLLRRFHDPDQITGWQQLAFPKDKPAANARPRPGALPSDPAEPGEPVFFLWENGELAFFGRAGMFRMPYPNCPRDFIPESLRDSADIDFAEALFGWTKDASVGHSQNSPARAFAGRVSVGDAVWISGEGDRFAETFVPRILGSPKPTAFQHYLTQWSHERDHLCHYDPANEELEEGQAPKPRTLRGHKLYWRRGRVAASEVQAEGQIRADSTQHTQLKPLNPNQTFRFRIWFDNLDARELGALAWALCPWGEEAVDYVHQLGMGKPLGLGSVKLSAKLTLVDRTTRYSSLFKGDGWTEAADPPLDLAKDQVLEKLIRPFEKAVLTALDACPDEYDGLADLPRLQALLKLMEWREQAPAYGTELPPPNAEEQGGQPHWKRRPVLPDPLNCVGDSPALTHRRKAVPQEPAESPAPSKPVRRTAPPASDPPAPSAAPELKPGNVYVPVIAVRGHQITVQFADDQQQRVDWPRYSAPVPAVGDTVRVKIKRINDGRVTAAEPNPE